MSLGRGKALNLSPVPDRFRRIILFPARRSGQSLHGGEWRVTAPPAAARFAAKSMPPVYRPKVRMTRSANRPNGGPRRSNALKGPVL